VARHQQAQRSPHTSRAAPAKGENSRQGLDRNTSMKGQHERYRHVSELAHDQPPRWRRAHRTRWSDADYGPNLTPQRAREVGLQLLEAASWVEDHRDDW